MTDVFDTVAASLARDIRAAWKHGITLRESGIVDIPALIDGIMSKTRYTDENEFIAASVLCATSFCRCCGAEEERDVRGLLRLFQIYNYHESIGMH